jgi:protein-disulfide isomerase
MKDLLRGRNGLLAGVGAVAVLIAVGLIVASQVGSGGGKQQTASTRPVTGSEATAALFEGIPQRLDVLGEADAPYTFVEFADPQCPFCREFTDAALPALVRDYVRTGKMKVVFSGMHFIGADSERALRAVYAAGIQNRAWQFLDLLYRNQGGENQGWVTDDLLRSIGRAIPGLDTGKMLSDMSAGAVTNAIAVSDQRATEAGVNSTPTFFAGKTGGTLQHLAVSELTAPGLRRALAPIVE